MTDERRRTRRRFLRTSGALAAAAGLAGCSFHAGPVDIEVGEDGDDGDETTPPGDDEDPGDATATDEPTDTPRGPTGGRLELVGSTLSSLDPVVATDHTSERVIQNLFDGLTTLEDGGADASLQLAASVDVSSDHRTYTFTLGDATFHDGRPVTAGDVVYSWERLGASEHSRNGYLLTDVLRVDHRTTTDGNGNEVYRPGSMKVTAEDERTLRVELLAPNHAALAILAHPAFSVVPEGIVGDVAGYPGELRHEAFSGERPVGAGPFVLDDWARSDEVVLARFEDYHGPTALLDGVRWRVITDSDAAYRYGQDRESDLVYVPESEWDPSLLTVDRTDDAGRRFGSYGPMDNGRTVDYLGVPELTTFYVAFNTDEVEKPARQAFAYVMNQQEVASQVFHDRSVPAATLTPPGIFPGGRYDSVRDQYPYGHDATEIGMARQVMEDAGYAEYNQYEFTVTAFQSPSWKQVLQLMQDKLGAAHIDLRYEQERFGTLVNRASKGNVDAYTLGDRPVYTTRPDEVFERLAPPNTDTSDSESDGMYVDWEGTDAASRAESAYRTVENNQAPTDAARRAREGAYVSMERANWEDVVVLPVVHGMEERFAYEWADVPPFGAAGSHRQMLNEAALGERDA